MTMGMQIVNAHMKLSHPHVIDRWELLANAIDRAIAEAVRESPAVAALRAAVPKICAYCRAGVRHADDRCNAAAERAVLARIDAAGKAGRSARPR